ncbi:hypothetical protein GCM10025872_11400 [Barrientosiimonas endolithica]|uniref:Uncharacterized protein n=1 Tax=Barrientosiimonas endolithica TaxID=1535208 RepID=A0ABM8H990_9MICO|nr:hypothetical protein GCM10025872_11400 [Barrientosiimonas endolithica]
MPRSARSGRGSPPLVVLARVLPPAPAFFLAGGREDVREDGRVERPRLAEARWDDAD